MPETQRRRKQERWQNGFYHHGHAEKSIGLIYREERVLPPSPFAKTANGRQKMEVIK
jgi:hypothetical protein